MHKNRLDSLLERLEAVEPARHDSKRAAVAVILRKRVLPETLLIKRAEKLGDPWSGQIAFPGGKYQDEDRSLKATAVRETREEVGIDLGASRFLGYHGSFRTHTGTMEVVPAVFMLEGNPGITANEEVDSFKWASLDDIASEGSRFSYGIRLGGVKREVPAIKIGDYVIWGLTHRIISSVILGEPV